MAFLPVTCEDVALLAHSAEDYNEDHIITHRLVRHCCMIASLPLLPTKSPCLKAHPAVFCVEPHGPIPFAPTHFVDISKVEAEKVRSVTPAVHGRANGKESGLRVKGCVSYCIVLLLKCTA